MDGEVTIQRGGDEKPFVYRGFQMVSETKLRELRGDVLRTWNHNGLLSLIFAHLHSLELIRDIFERPVQLGRGTVQARPLAHAWARGPPIRVTTASWHFAVLSSRGQTALSSTDRDSISTTDHPAYLSST